MGQLSWSGASCSSYLCEYISLLNSQSNLASQTSPNLQGIPLPRCLKQTHTISSPSSPSPVGAYPKVCHISRNIISKDLADISIGYDEGGFSASVGLKSFQKDYNLIPANWKHDPSGLASRKANISSFGVLGAALGALLCLTLTDRLGRLRCWQIFVVTWTCGLLMQIFSCGIYGFILFARIFGGLGAGGLTVVAPLFLSEIAPAKSRGMVVGIYMVILLTTLTMGKSLHKCSDEFLLLIGTTCRLLHQLWRQHRSSRYPDAIPPRASHPLNSRRPGVDRLLLPYGHPPLARLTKPL